MDASFALFEDDGSSTTYRSGIYSTIDVVWQDKSQQLKILSRKGNFPGMPQERRICAVVVSPGHGVGVREAVCDKKVTYTGEEIELEFHDLVVV